MGAKIIWLQDVGERQPNKEQESLIDMTEFYPEDDSYSEIIKYQKPLNINWVDVTVMDLFNLPIDTDFATDADIIDFIKQRLKIDVETPEGLNKINDLFKKTKKFYEERYLKTLPMKITKLEFKTLQSLLNFLRDTKRNKMSGAINCALAKIWYAIDDVLANEKVRRALFLDQQFISQHLEKPFQIEEWTEDKNGNIYRKWKVVINANIINFKLIARQKWSESIMWKQLAEAKYYSVNEFKDLVWVTIYTDNASDAALMMQYIDQMVYKGRAKIKNKDGIDPEAVKGLNLNDAFYKKLSKATSMNDENEEKSEEEEDFEKRKKSSSDKYKEVKLVWDVELSLEEWKKSTKYPIGTEIKFVIWGYDNESGISLQSLYDYMKRFRELTRLGIPIRKLDIINYVNDFFGNIDEILKKKNKEKHPYYIELYNDLYEKWFIDTPCVNMSSSNNHMQQNEKNLALGLYKYFESKLVKVKLPNSKKTYYFNEHILKMRDAGLYRDIEQI